MLRNATAAFLSRRNAPNRSAGSPMAFRSPRIRRYSAVIHCVIASMFSSSLGAVWFRGRSSFASVAFCATAWMIDPKFVAALPTRGPANRFSSIQHTGHAHRLSTADGDRVTTSELLASEVLSDDAGRADGAGRSAAAGRETAAAASPESAPSDEASDSARSESASDSMPLEAASVNGQLSGSAAATPRLASKASAAAASRA